MNAYTAVTRDDGIGVILLQKPPVNALQPELIAALRESLRECVADTSVRAIVIAGSGRVFVAGADIRAIQAASPGEDVPGWLLPLLLEIEDSGKPVVMAIHGVALGGGLELALAGHYRVAAAGTQFGLPEANLGLIPGWAGTQRLPRLVGVPLAIQMCVSGDPIEAEAARNAGLVDEVVEGHEVLAAAIRFARRPGIAPRKTRDLPVWGGSVDVFAEARRVAATTRPRQQAPLLAIEAIVAATDLPFDDACREESKLFTALLAGEQSQAMIYLFHAEREAAKPPAGTSAGTLRTIGVVGRAADGALIRQSSLECRAWNTVDEMAFDDQLDCVLLARAEDRDEVASRTRPDCVILGPGVSDQFAGMMIVGKLAQITKGRVTDEATVAAALALAKKLGLFAVQGAILPPGPPGALNDADAAAQGRQLLATGAAQRPGDIDVAYVHGWGYPPYLGGPMWQARRR